MKQLITGLLLLLFSHSFGQFSKKDQEVTAIFQDQDSIPRSVFLDSTLMGTMRVNAYNAKQTWTSTDKNEKKIEQLFDIRLKFDSNREALQFHEKYAEQNSEHGPEIKKHGLVAKGAEGFHAYNGEALVEKMVDRYGVRMYCFLFVVDNYFVKVYVSCNKSFNPSYFQPMITDIISRIKLLDQK